MYKVITNRKNVKANVSHMLLSLHVGGLLLRERIVGWQSLAVLFIHFSVALFNTRKILLKEHEVLFYMTKQVISNSKVNWSESNCRQRWWVCFKSYATCKYTSSWILTYSSWSFTFVKHYISNFQCPNDVLKLLLSNKSLWNVAN